MPKQAQTRNSIEMEAQQSEETADKHYEYERAKRHALAWLERGLPMGGTITATREELHERSPK